MPGKKLKLVVQMIVRNEFSRYLKKVLESIERYASPSVDLKILILDDSSTDKTPELCQSFPSVILNRRSGKSLWETDESKLRNQLWEEVRKLKPDWVLTQDADELFDKSFQERLPELLNSNWDWFAFRLCDMWDENHYRIDGYWSPGFRRLFRFQDEPFGIIGRIHAGCIPEYVVDSNHGTCYNDIRVKHFSWMGEENRKQKQKLYAKIPMAGINAEHFASVKKTPRLKEWKDEIEYPKIKICSLFKNDEWCMDEFLTALANQNYPKKKLSLYFIENDSTDKTLARLEEWSNKWREQYQDIKINSLTFGVPGKEHEWPDQVLQHMTSMRNSFLGNIGDNDYIFNLDSDVVLQPQTLRQLALSDRDVICEVFWARWDRTDDRLMPNVWPYGGYDGVSENYMAMLQRKGSHTVGGLGACNLISKCVIEKGCSFDPVPNLPLTMRGEDRHFCIRARVLGFFLWADTYFPAKHLEHFDYDFRKKLKIMREERSPGNRLSLVMIVNNEEYMLENFLYRMGELFNEIIIVDTGSRDDSKAVARKYTDKIYDFKWSNDFSEVRNFAIGKVTCPWIFYADPDENYGTSRISHFNKMIKVENSIGFVFLVFNYRGDRPQPALSESVRLFRNLPEIRFTGLVHETLDISISQYIKEHPGIAIQMSPIPMYHWGFVKGEKERVKKLAYYRKLNEKQLKAHPKDCRPYYNLAMHFLEEEENKDEGIKLLRKSIELSPTFYQPRRELGLYHLREAQKQFTESFKLLPPTHPFHNFQRRAVEWIGNFLGEGSKPQTIEIEPGARVR